MEFRFQAGDDAKVVQIERSGEQYVIIIGDARYDVIVNRAASGEIVFTVDGQAQRVLVANDGQWRYVAFDANVFMLEKTDASKKLRRNLGAGENTLTAAMHGQVIKVLIGEGDTVVRGQPLVLLEAMKMELRIAAPHDGHVVKLLCNEGQVVERGQVLVELGV